MSSGGSPKPKRKSVTQLPMRRGPLPDTAENRRSLARGVVLEIAASGAIRVRCSADAVGELDCDLLQTSGGPTLRLEPGASVLVFLPSGAEDRGVVIGRIGSDRRQEETPEALILEATTSMVLRCGESSITLRNDGKVLVKGKDVVSHAARLNRIRGGAVSIN